MSYNFDGTNLVIGDGGLMGSPASGTLTLTQNATSVTVTDTTSKTFSVSGNITIRLNSQPATVNVALGSNTMLGNLSLYFGANNPSMINNVNVTGTGCILGNFSVTGGTDTIMLSPNGTDSVTMPQKSVAQFRWRSGELDMFDPTTINGNVTATGVTEFTTNTHGRYYWRQP